MKKTDPEVQAMTDMIAELASFKHISASGGSLHNAGGLMVSVSVTPQRNGAQVWAVAFYATAPDDLKLNCLVLAATLYELWPSRCLDLFGSSMSPLRVLPGKPKEYWGLKSGSKMLRTVEKALKNGAQIHPAVMKLVSNIRDLISGLPKPIDMHINDIKHPLKMAIKKGASREDLIRLVDEAIAESVMGA